MFPSFVFVCPSNCGLRDLDADHAGQAFADVVAADAGVLQILREVVLRRVGVDRSRQRRAEAGEVGAAFVRVDVVREREDQLRIAVVPLQGDLGVDAVLVALHEDRLLVDERLVLVQMLDERDDAAFVLELVALAVALIVDRDEDAAVQECEFAESLGQRVEAVFGRLENLRVWLERDLRAAALRRPGDFELAGWIAALVTLLVDLAVAPDLEVEALGQRVDDGDADAVQTARDFVAVVIELAASVQDRQHDFRSGLAAGVAVDRNPAAVVDDGDRVVDVDRDVDLIAVAGERLVDRVVDDFVDEMMQPGRTGGADVHGRALPHGLEPFENLDLVGAVIVCGAVPVGTCRCIASPTLRGRRRAPCAVLAALPQPFSDRVGFKRPRSNPHRHDHVGVVVPLCADGLHHGLADFVLERERDDVGLDDIQEVEHILGVERNRQRRAAVFDGKLLVRFAELRTARCDFDLPLVDFELDSSRSLIREQRHALDGVGQPLAIEFDRLSLPFGMTRSYAGNWPSIIREIRTRPPTSKKRWFSPLSN